MTEVFRELLSYLLYNLLTGLSGVTQVNTCKLRKYTIKAKNCSYSRPILTKRVTTHIVQFTIILRNCLGRLSDISCCNSIAYTQTYCESYYVDTTDNYTLKQPYAGYLLNI